MKYVRLEKDSWLRWSAPSPSEAKVCMMGVPFDLAVSLNKGAAKAPERLRELSVDMSDMGEDMIPIQQGILYDLGDVPVTLDWEAYFHQVEDEAFQLMRSGRFCLFFGGDHSVTIPLHKAFGRYQRQRKENARIGVIHFDAHYDLCPKYDGHPWSHACTEARALEGIIQGENLTFVGIRVAEVSELETLKKNPGITTIRARDIYIDGVESICQRLIEHYRDYDAVYVTLDIDVLDPAYAPGTGTPSTGGLTSRELLEILRQLLNTLPIQAMDIVEVAPSLDVNDITSWAALGVVQMILAHFSKEIASEA